MDLLERLLCSARRLGTVVALDDLPRQRHLGRLGVPAAQRPDLRRGAPAEQLVIAPHQRVRDAHQLAVLVPGRLVDAHVVPQRLGHLVADDLPVHLARVDSFQERPGQADLRELPVLLLQGAADEQVEELVGRAQLHVRFQRHRVVPLRQRVEQLVQRDRHLARISLLEVIPLQHARQRVLRRQLDEARRAQRQEPLAVEPHLGAAAIEQLEDLLLVRLGVGGDLLLG